MKSFIAGAVVALPMLAQAHMPYTMAECKQMSQVIYLAARAKERGADNEQIVAAAESTIKSLAMSQSFIKDDFDAAGTMIAIKAVIAADSAPIAQMDAAYESCVSILMKTTEI